MADLAYVLRQLPRSSDPNLMVGDHFGDDAAVYRIADDVALVQTVDFVTPIVDDPYLFGQIAAANSLSDVYAIGGKPLTALNIAGFPVTTLPPSTLGEILRGGAEKAREAGVTIVGGHTVDDAEPKYGLAVTGTVHPHRFVDGRGARPGDVLVLTKPLGSGTIATALKAGRAEAHHVSQAVRWMTLLNRGASTAMLRAGAHASTDVTGFGLLGHLHGLCEASGVAAEVSLARCPTLPGALEYVRAGYVPGGTLTNRAALQTSLELDTSLDEDAVSLLCDPQTSGGLLIALPPEGLRGFREAAGDPSLATEIGRIVAGEAGTIHVDP